MQEKLKPLPLYRDLPFKNLFGTQKNVIFTKDLLDSLFKLEKGVLDNLKISNSVKLDRETIVNRQFELDVTAETSYGEIFNLEMQTKLGNNEEIKNTMYIMRLFSSQPIKGEKYQRVEKVTQVEFVKEFKIHNDNELIKRYYLTNVNNPKDKILEDKFEVIIVNIEKKIEKPYNGSRFEKWIKFINASTREEAKEIAKDDPLLMEALKEMERFESNDYVQDYTREEMLIESNLELAKEEGRASGLRDEKRLIATNLIKNTTMSLEEISTYTDLSIEELINLKKEISKD